MKLAIFIYNDNPFSYASFITIIFLIMCLKTTILIDFGMKKTLIVFILSFIIFVSSKR